MEYTILYANSPFEMTKAVKAFIKDGWIPQGGIAIDSLGRIFQAMIRL